MEEQKIELKMIRMSEVQAQEIEWLWYPFIPYGKLTIIQGDPGDGKIDSIAGPSEIAIIADENANPTFIAADMMSQAEHGTGFEASTTFCLSEEQAIAIKREIERLCNENDLINATEKTFTNYGDIFIVDSIDEAVDAVNVIAPEHILVFNCVVD